MPRIVGTSLADRIVPGSVSAGVTGGPVTELGDQIFGGAGNDTITGGSGDDVIYGGNGTNLLSGGLANDTYAVTSPEDIIVEAANGRTDTVFADVSYSLSANIEIGRAMRGGIILSEAPGGPLGVQLVASVLGADTLIGGGGNDTLWGSAGSVLNGGAGNDTLRDQGAPATMAGGAGDDSYAVDNASSTVQETAGEGTDTLYVTVDGYVMPLNVEIFRLAGMAVYATGNAGNDQLVANPYHASTLDGQGGNDTLWGSAFGDVMLGRAGDDILLGLGGADTISGGTGDDYYVVSDPTAVISENAGEGQDRVVFNGTLRQSFHRR